MESFPEAGFQLGQEQRQPTEPLHQPQPQPDLSESLWQAFESMSQRLDQQLEGRLNQIENQIRSRLTPAATEEGSALPGARSVPVLTARASESPLERPGPSRTHPSPFLSLSSAAFPRVPSRQPSPTPLQPRSGRQQLPVLSTFDGKREHFPVWKLEAEAKLRIEGYVIGSPEAQFYYIYGCLAEKVKAVVSSFISFNASQSTFDPKALLAYLERNYGDPNRAEKALSRLSTLRQSENALFAHFLPLFEKELVDAGGHTWPDSVKVNYLHQALNQQLKNDLVTILDLPRDNYVEFLQRVTLIASRREAIRTAPSTQRWQSPPRVPQVPNQGPSRELMDWEPTKTLQVAALQQANQRLQGKRAKWVSQEELQARKKENRCFRCGRKGCKVEQCPLLPARRPSSQQPQQRSFQQQIEALVASAAVEEVEQLEELTDSSVEDSDNLGKA